MKRITNEKLKKEINKTNHNLIIGLIAAILAISCFIIGYFDSKQKPKDTTYLNTLIESESEDVENKESHLKITMTPVLFAKMNNGNIKYYITMDEKYYYIIALTDKEFDKIAKEDLEKNPLTIYGTSKGITSDIADLALEYYNSAVEEEYQIKKEDFYSKFGDLYLDTTEDSSLAAVFYVLGGVAMLFSLVFIGTFCIAKNKINKVLKKYEDEELAKIEKEIADEESFHYERARLILTKNYIISFVNGLSIIRYEDIIWLYEYKLKQYGITTQKSIMVMTANKKPKPIISLDGVTRKSKLVFDEITETILSKNKNILVGYTKENQKYIKENYN